MANAAKDGYSEYEPTPTPRAGNFLDNLEHNFGAKDIAYFSGIALLINNITGPGVPQLPNMFVEAGWLLPTIILVTVWGMTTLSASMYAEAMANIPGNDQFQKRVEYSTIVKYYFGRNWYIAAQVNTHPDPAFALLSLQYVTPVISPLCIGWLKWCTAITQHHLHHTVSPSNGQFNRYRFYQELCPQLDPLSKHMDKQWNWLSS